IYLDADFGQRLLDESGKHRHIFAMGNLYQLQREAFTVFAAFIAGFVQQGLRTFAIKRIWLLAVGQIERSGSRRNNTGGRFTVSVQEILDEERYIDRMRNRTTYAHIGNFLATEIEFHRIEILIGFGAFGLDLKIGIAAQSVEVGKRKLRVCAEDRKST